MLHTIRPATPADALEIARIRVATWQHAYRDILPAQYLASLSAEEAAVWLADTLRRGGRGKFALLAEDENGSPAGYALGGPERDNNPQYTGEIYAIYVLPEYQRRGIGRDLFIESARSLAGEQMPAMLLWVLADNRPSRAFYESMGGTLIETDMTELAGGNYAIAAYGWPDLANLLKNH